MRLSDNFGRKINYLRLSVTDRCNMRCVYCMPAGGIDKLSHTEILSYEQFLLIARAAVSLGVEKIRVTGGEPLVRHGIVPFLEQLGQLTGLKQLVLTTNGVKLSGMAQALKDAGVQRLNISLDSLQPEMFSQLTRKNLLREVLNGIDAAEKIGLTYKINMVVMRGRNDQEILDFAALTKSRSCTVRFIEYMPALKQQGWRSLVVPSAEVLQQLQQHYILEPVDRGGLAGPAREFALAGAQGRIGVIDPLSGHFCRDCNRIRITASGQVRSCLFSDNEFDLQPLLKLNNVEKLALQLKELVSDKPACHALNSSGSEHSAFSMAQIGG
ncbi:MAG: GTP 3',8-cyclase MoaA [Deltaproteobacteria bacterium]|jgi:cyclic pyranopterin phosphate synthase|nr:GTP 3',8-cyclase MoaA [Deltaproteobacteria bacterium]